MKDLHALEEEYVRHGRQRIKDDGGVDDFPGDTTMHHQADEVQVEPKLEGGKEIIQRYIVHSSCREILAGRFDR